MDQFTANSSEQTPLSGDYIVVSCQFWVNAIPATCFVHFLPEIQRLVPPVHVLHHLCHVPPETIHQLPVVKLHQHEFRLSFHHNLVTFSDRCVFILLQTFNQFFHFCKVNFDVIKNSLTVCFNWSSQMLLYRCIRRSNFLTDLADVEVHILNRPRDKNTEAQH